MSRIGTTKSIVRNRRERNEQAARLIAFGRRVGLIAGAVLLTGALGSWAYLSGAVTRVIAGTEQKAYDMAGDAGFTVQDLLVEGRINSDADVLRAILNVQRGDPILAFDPKEAKDLIERISWVREAHVERRLPDTIYIGLMEREPMALWQNKGKLRVIDSEGVTLSDSRLAPFRDLIILVGDDAPAHAPELLGLLEAEPVIGDRVEAATWIGDRRWDLKLKNGITVKLPESDVGLALGRLAQQQQTDFLLEKDLESIDIRDPARMVVRTRPGAVQGYKAGAKKEDI